MGPLEKDLGLSSIKEKKSLANFKKWTDIMRTLPLPGYLCQPTPMGLRWGRRIKTRIRLGCHDFNECCAHEARTTDVKFCKCCNPGGIEESPYHCVMKKIESPYHAVMKCTAYDQIRKEAFDQIHAIYPRFCKLSDEEKMDFLFADNTPIKVSNRLYRFLQNAF